MIRIVEILKRAGEWKGKGEPEKQEEKKEEKSPLPVQEKEAVRIAPIVKKELVEKLTGDRLKKLFNEIISTVNQLLTKSNGRENASESAGVIISHLGKMVDQEIIGNQELIVTLERDFPSNKTLKVIFYSIKLGRDASYERDRLIDLAAAALVQGIESSVQPGGYDVRSLKATVGHKANINDEADKGLISLAEIYVNK